MCLHAILCYLQQFQIVNGILTSTRKTTKTRPSGQEFQDVSVEDLQDGRYKVTFLPLTPGSLRPQLDVSGVQNLPSGIIWV